MSSGAARSGSGLRFGIDGEALRQPLSGVGRYVFNLCRELDTLLPEVGFFAYGRIGPERLCLPSPRWRWRRESVAALRRVPSFLWLKTRGAALCREDDLDVFWAGRTLHPRLGPGVYTVCTVHDLNHRIVPETMQRSTLWSHRLWFDDDLKQAGAVVANSQGTRRRLERALGIAVAEVVRPGLDPAYARQPDPSSPAAARLERWGVRAPYLLAVATLEPRKNIEILLRAFLELSHAGRLPGFQLVIVGAPGWQSQALVRALDAARERGVRLLGDVPDAAMPALYATAEAFVCPSLYEGFGMPVLEARACGTRVVISNLPELCEAGGPHAVRVEPTLEGVREGILQALATPRRPEPGLVERHSWREGAERMARLLHARASRVRRAGDAERKEAVQS
jgi:glycosyltransferase involved in cell wall biosynthesis